MILGVFGCHPSLRFSGGCLAYAFILISIMGLWQPCKFVRAVGFASVLESSDGKIRNEERV